MTRRSTTFCHSEPTGNKKKLVRQLDEILSNAGYFRSNLDRVDESKREIVSARLEAANASLRRIFGALKPIGEIKNA